MNGKLKTKEFRRFLQEKRGYRGGVDFPQAQFFKYGMIACSLNTLHR
jgi:hypothetical protein